VFGQEVKNRSFFIIP